MAFPREVTCRATAKHRWPRAVVAPHRVLVVIAVAALSGCGSDRLETFPVQGRVLVDGQPAAGARVTFIPQGGSEAFRRERPIATTDPDGNFSLTTFLRGDGAPAGEYVVTVKWRTQAVAQGTQPIDEERRRAPAEDRLGGRYRNPEVSALRATIRPEENQLDPFELTTR